MLGFTSFMIYQYRTAGSQRYGLEDIAPQAYKGPSGKSEEEPPPLPEKAASRPAPPPAAEPPPVAVAPPGTPLEAVSAETLRTNPFAKGKVILFFPHNSNELSGEVTSALDQIAAYLKSQPGLAVAVRGYTDAVGSATYNLSVAQFRANSIKSYLAGKGVNPNLLQAVGLGAKDPIASNDTPEGRQQNRRVEIEPVR
jgi:outer membrane protein OmpA-like peptidoglycan-associated protein